MFRTGEQIAQPANQRRREVMIEQEFHSFAEIIRCSRSAA